MMNLKMLRKYFLIFKYAKGCREQFEDMKIDEFEDVCFYDDAFDYLI